jgi:PAS domain S-box-containing protein
MAAKVRYFFLEPNYVCSAFGVNMACPRILVADDRDQIRSGIRELVATRPGWEVCCEAVDGHEAFEKAQALKPNVVILNARMPSVDGFDAASVIQQQLPKSAILIINERRGSRNLPVLSNRFMAIDEIGHDLLRTIESSLATDHRAAAQLLQIKEHPPADVRVERDRFLELFERAPVPVALLTGPGHIFVYVNDSYLKLTGRKREELLGNAFRESFPEVEGQGYFETMDRVFRTGEGCLAREREVKLNRFGTLVTIYLDFSCYPRRNASGQTEGILFQCAEVTDRVLARTRLEEAIKSRTTDLDQAHETVRGLTESLMSAQEEERRRLALELHDSAGQFLVAIKWKLELLSNEATEGQRSRDALSDCLSLVDELSREVRTISHLLHPPLLDDMKLSSALPMYLEDLSERSGLLVFLEMDSELPQLPKEAETTVFRVIQEALTNVYRHAKTNRAEVRIRRTSDGISVQIQDRGPGIRGYTADRPNAKVGLGIRGMRERIRQLKGTFKIESGTGGTTVTAVVPTGLAA